MKISFHGADRSVTGSCHLLECNGLKILIDCGLYQGGRESEEENAEPFGFEPASIDFLLLTHAHLDHCGRIPLLYKRGFRGEIVTTSASRELARLVLLDSAHLQEEEAKYRARKAARHGKEREFAGPLYTVADTLNCFDAFGRKAQFDVPLQLAPGVGATFSDAGHILGSASILFELEEAGKRRRVLFSGDIGSPGHPLLRAARPASDCNVVVMETTYGDRLHKPLEPSVKELYQAINDTFRRGGNVIIPTFALERAQELLYFLRVGAESNAIPASTQVFLDSPMAISATEIFERHTDCYAPEAAAMFEQGKDPFHLKNLHYVHDASDSMALNRISAGAIIMAGAGMCTGGRVRHHLKHNLWRRECSIVFVGFAAKGTLARQIIDGAREVKIFGEDIPVHATICTINGFSAHADQKELLDWHRRCGNPDRTFLVHGEQGTMKSFAALLNEPAAVTMPDLNESFEI
jgi:metallo-beta-lactamase family protein